MYPLLSSLILPEKGVRTGIAYHFSDASTKFVFENKKINIWRNKNLPSIYTKEIGLYMAAS